MSSIIAVRESLDLVRADYLEKTLTSPGYQVLKEVIASLGAEAQIHFSEYSMYPGNPDNARRAEAAGESAREVSAALDMLRDIEKKSSTKDNYTVTISVKQ